LRELTENLLSFLIVPWRDWTFCENLSIIMSSSASEEADRYCFSGNFTTSELAYMEALKRLLMGFLESREIVLV
jgi:hypothetical protein